MNKNSFLPDNPARTKTAFAALLGMLIGFFLSRSLLSVSMFVFGIACLWGTHPKNWLKEKWWLLGVIWVGFYFISYFWSNNFDYWNTRTQVKLPFLFLPLAFAYMPRFSQKQLNIFTGVLLSLLMIGVGYSLSFLLRDSAFYIKGYDYSHVLPTIPKNDHIRFSMMVTGGIIWTLYYYPNLLYKWVKTAVIFILVILSIYLHILAARAGLMAWYLFMISWLIYLILNKKTRKTGITLVAFISFASIIAFQNIPTLRARIGYFKYSLIVFKEGQRNGLYSDMGRVISYDIAWCLMKQKPLLGVGAGNILDTMKNRYTQWYPEVGDEQKLIPHNQAMTVGVACGIPAMLVFIAWLLYPIIKIKRNREGFFFFITWFVMLIPLMVEPVLEVQFGVFVVLFFISWQMSFLRKSIEEPNT